MVVCFPFGCYTVAFYQNHWGRIVFLGPAVLGGHNFRFLKNHCALAKSDPQILLSQSVLTCFRLTKLKIPGCRYHLFQSSGPLKNSDFHSFSFLRQLPSFGSTFWGESTACFRIKKFFKRHYGSKDTLIWRKDTYGRLKWPPCTVPRRVLRYWASIILGSKGHMGTWPP